MPNNRNAQLRYQVIDKCLQNRRRRWTWKDILEQVNIALLADDECSNGIGKTTLYEDLKDIETRIFHLPIERIKDGKTTYLRYADPNDSINKQPISNKEAEQLKSAIALLSRFKGTPQFEWVNEIIPIIESKIGLIKTEKEIISFDSNIDYSGAIHIPALFNAIHNRRVINVIYQDFKSPISYELELHPQYLKQYNSRWFLLSLIDKWGDKPQTHALDRIIEIREIKAKYREVKGYDWDHYFSDMIGVTRLDTKPVVVKLLILDAEQASYIDTKPLHQSQKKLKKVDGGYEVNIEVIPNYELEKLILSFGERVKVLSPSTLEKNIAKRVVKLNQLYLLNHE